MNRAVLILAAVFCAGTLSLTPASASRSAAVYAAAAETEFVGLGLQLKSESTADGYYVVDGIVDAASDQVKKAVKKGDQIVEVDDKAVKEKTIQEVVDSIRGPEGTQVKLKLKREGEEQLIEAKLTRTKIKLPD
jgi:carboxyl-terminal processing protease